MRRTQRLRSPRAFRRVREAGRTWAHPLFILSAAPNRFGRTRCGFVVSKTLGGAVQRNRLKRRLREAVRLIFDHIVAGWDIIFIVRKAMIKADYAQVCTAVQRLLNQAQLWQDEPNTKDM